MNKKKMGKIALKRSRTLSCVRKGALGMREARREKRQSRAVLAAIWGLLEQLGIGQKLVQREVVCELEPQAKRSLNKSVLELCSALKRVGISASRWATCQQLPNWDWDEVKRMIRHLDEDNAKAMTLRRTLGEQIKEHLENAPRSYAEAIYQAQNPQDIFHIVKGAEKAQRAQLTRLQTELERDGPDGFLIQNQRRLAQSVKTKRFDEKSQDNALGLKMRLETEIERARDALGNLTSKVACHLAKIGEEESVKAPTPMRMGRNQSSLIVKRRRGRPPMHDKFAIKHSSALDQAQHKWEMAYLEIKKLLKASRGKS